MNNFEDKFNRIMFAWDAEKRSRLWKKLGTLLSNGVPLLDAVTSVHRRQIANGNGKQPFAIALADWIAQIRNGRRLSQAIEGWVPRDEQMLLAAGEHAGTLDLAMSSTAEIMLAKKKIRSAVIGGLAYPVTMLMMGFAMLIMFSYKVIPAFSRIVPDEKWLGIARFIVDLANFARDWLPLLLTIVVAIVIAFFASLSRWNDSLRVILDRYPPYSIYRMQHGSSWLISFSALVAAGVRVESAIEQLAQGATPWLKKRLDACLREMRSGLHAGDALAKTGYEFPDQEIIDDLCVYSKLSGFDRALSVIGRQWMAESVEEIQGMMKIVFGISVLVVGLFIAIMVSGLLGMELQMTSIMQGSHR